jgi:hypothetical protein
MYMVVCRGEDPLFDPYFSPFSGAECVQPYELENEMIVPYYGPIFIPGGCIKTTDL